MSEGRGRLDAGRVNTALLRKPTRRRGCGVCKGATPAAYQPIHQVCVRQARASEVVVVGLCVCTYVAQRRRIPHPGLDGALAIAIAMEMGDTANDVAPWRGVASFWKRLFQTWARRSSASRGSEGWMRRGPGAVFVVLLSPCSLFFFGRCRRRRRRGSGSGSAELWLGGGPTRSLGTAVDLTGSSMDAGPVA